MTALSKYDRLEATALWRANADAQRREVIVSIGDATLTIASTSGPAITHWSLAALERANPGKRPALYHPDGDPDETLEIDEDGAEMIDAIETLRRAVLRARPKPGRLRWLGMVLSIAAVVALAVFWLPGALVDHTVRVVPKVGRDIIGSALLTRIEAKSGPACVNADGLAALDRLSTRLRSGPLKILPGMAKPSLHLPGGVTLLNSTLVEDFEEPDVAAGYAVLEAARRGAQDPLRALLDHAGVRASFQLLTTGALSPETLDDYATYLLTAPQADPPLATLLARFEATALRSTPFAYARDVTGETTLPFIEGDPMNGRLTAPLLSDGTWLRLQSICNG